MALFPLAFALDLALVLTFTLALSELVLALDLAVVLTFTVALPCARALHMVLVLLWDVGCEAWTVTHCQLYLLP